MQTIDQIGAERRERFRHEVRVNSLRTPKPTEAPDLAYTEEDRAAYLAFIKGEGQ